MSGSDIKVDKLEVRDIDLRIRLDGNKIVVELPLTKTGNPREMPFSALDERKKEDYLTNAHNRITDYLAGKNASGFQVEKVTESGKIGGNLGGKDSTVSVTGDLSKTQELTAIYNDPKFTASLQRGFDEDRKKNYLDATISWTRGINGDGGARIDYNKEIKEDKVTLKVEDKVAFNYFKENIKGLSECRLKDDVALKELSVLMGARAVGKHLRSSSEEPGSQTLVASNDHSVANTAQTNSSNAQDFKNNPRVQEIYAALDRNGENPSPSLVAGLAGAAANLSKVQDVALTPQTAFALDRDKSDPAANRVQVSMDVANKPFDEVWQKASVALQQTQTPTVVAQAQGQDLEQKQSARTM